MELPLVTLYIKALCTLLAQFGELRSVYLIQIHFIRINPKENDINSQKRFQIPDPKEFDDGIMLVTL